jgi:hypothetical protein
MSTSNAFEIDNLRIGAVPEPASWVLMLLGFAGVGLAMRRDGAGRRAARLS